MHGHHLLILTNQLPEPRLVFLGEVGELRNNHAALRALGTASRQGANDETDQLVFGVGFGVRAHAVAERKSSGTPGLRLQATRPVLTGVAWSAWFGEFIALRI